MHMETSVQAAQRIIASWKSTDLFCNEQQLEEPSSVLYNISSGVVVSDVVQADLLQARQTGERSFVKFVKERIRSDSVNFF